VGARQHTANVRPIIAHTLFTMLTPTPSCAGNGAVGGSIMGSSGSGRISDYPGSSGSGSGTSTGGGGGSAGGSDRCAQAIAVALEDIEHCDFYKTVGTVFKSWFRMLRTFLVFRGDISMRRFGPTYPIRKPAQRGGLLYSYRLMSPSPSRSLRQTCLVSKPTIPWDPNKFRDYVPTGIKQKK
jgi:hypothetical protein